MHLVYEWKKGKNRQRQGYRSRFCEAHLERGECICNLRGTKVIFPELADISLYLKVFCNFNQCIFPP